jgi:magnesium chelatase subunit D
MDREDILYPFSAIVGQERMKRALLLNAVDFKIGGVLIKGERGTGKSSAARSLSELLPQMETVADCPFACDPHQPQAMCDSCLAAWEAGQPLPVATRRPSFVTLPLNATEDRVVGTLDLQRALQERVKSFEPGVLAAANRSILYVDEVNLLEDHLVDILLDAAAMGVNAVERESVSFRHPASFLLVGTMNPEEGDLRPQLEDRFGLCVEVRAEQAAADRIEIMRRRDSFARDPYRFRLEYEGRQQELRESILRARDLLPRVSIADPMLAMISDIALELGVPGHRADIAACRAARALAAVEGSELVDENHVREAAVMAFLHRLRKNPFDDGEGMERLERVIAKKGRLISVAAEQSPGSEAEAQTAAVGRERGGCEEDAKAGKEGLVSRMPGLEGEAVKAWRAVNGRRSLTLTESGEGKRAGQRIPDPGEALRPGSLALDATLRAAAARSAAGGKPFAVEKQDMRKAIRKRKGGNLILFILDASASMGCDERIECTREAACELLVDAYQKRDRVGLITFRDARAQLVLSPTSSLQLARMRLKEMGTGGATPLNHGLALALETAKRELARNPGINPLLVLITDGYGNVAYASKDPAKESTLIAARIRQERLKSVVFDTSNGASLFKRNNATSPARRIADAMGASYYPLAPSRPEDMLARLGKKFELE